MADEDWRKDPKVLEKYTWGKDDVVWGRDEDDTGPPPPPIKGLETKEERRAAWRSLNPDKPYPPTLQEPGDESSTSDSKKSRPKVQVHFHRPKR